MAGEPPLHMIDEPSVVSEDSFQEAWKAVVELLQGKQWEMRNLMVQVKSPTAFDGAVHRKVESFCALNNILSPRHVAYTIFPHDFYQHRGNAERLFADYNKENGYFERLQNRLHNKSSWGTYFRRLTHYESPSGTVNQLANVIKAINTRANVSKAALTLVIQKPGGETVRPLGGPCLNYLAVQEERTSQTVLGLLAVYRNHDFLQKAYGNYWALCNLLRFLAAETRSQVGPITCVSSHAYVDSRRPALSNLLTKL